MIARARIPAPRSSIMMPVPSGSRSNSRIGKGLRISKTRKSIRPTRNVFHDRGTAINETSWPATSSMTTNCGSLMPVARTTRVEAGMPMSVTTKTAMIVARVRLPTGMSEDVDADNTAPHRTMVAIEAQVPGPGLRRPMPKKVATSVAQRGALDRGAAADAGGEPALSREAAGREERADSGVPSDCRFCVIRVCGRREDREFPLRR
jgi:hypothetical protein